MTVYKGSTKLDAIYKGGTKIRRIYKGSQLVYTRPSITYSGSTGGTVSGNNFWNNQIKVEGTITGNITYRNSNIGGVWRFLIYTDREHNTSNVTLTINAIYANGTKAQVFYKNDFPNPGNSNPTDWVFYVNMPQSWTGYEVIATSNRTFNVFSYFYVKINEIERIETDQPL